MRLLLVLGLSWLRKAILRASGHKDPHDEDRIFAATVAELSVQDEAAAAAPTAAGTNKQTGRTHADRTHADRTHADRTHDGVGFAVAFKGVFLEGTEVVLIVISLGAAQHHLGLAALACRRGRRRGGGGRPAGGPPAERGPREHDQDSGRGHVDELRRVLGRRGRGRALAGSDLAIPVLVGFFVVVFFAFTAFMRTQLPAPVRAEATP